MKKIIIILGPTCSKKNSLAKIIAKEFLCPIVNADPFQTYKELNVGVNKPTENELHQYNYFFVNNNSIFDNWDVSIFQKQFYALCDSINNETVILCGGSHLYIDSIVSGYNFTEMDLDAYINELDKKFTNEQLYDYIVQNDYEYSQKISINNRRRLLRSVAVMQSENTTMTSIANSNKPKYKSIVICCNKPREELYNAINNRVDLMINNGWINEVQQLYTKYGEQLTSLKAFKAIGYNEILESIKTNSPLNIEYIKQKTRRLAKMQLTWCNNKFINKLEYEHNKTNPLEILEKVKEFLNEN